MSNKILFLYFNKKHKTELLKCENIIKALFRKFRKSVVFSYMEIDTSVSCREMFKKVLFEHINKNHAVMVKCSYDTFAAEEIFFNDILPFSVAEYHVSGKVLCYPSSVKTKEATENFVSEKHTISVSNLKEAIQTSLNLARNRKKELLVCTHTESFPDRYLFGKLHEATDKSAHIQTEHISVNKMISLCMKTVPSFDTVLSTEDISKIIGMHLDSGSRICSGFSVFHTEKGHICTIKTNSYEEMSNARFASVLLAFAYILEIQLDMKSTSDWLRKAVATTFETYANSSFEEFEDKVISEIQKPMRIKK